MTPLDRYQLSRKNDIYQDYVSSDDQHFGLKYLQALESLAKSHKDLITCPTIQAEIIHMSNFARILGISDQKRYMDCCEKLLPIDCILEMMDKNATLAANYLGDNQTIKSYIKLMS